MSKPKFINSINYVDLKSFKKAFELSANNKDWYGDTALMIIIKRIKRPECTKENKKKYYSMIDIILENDEFDVNAKNKQGDTALHLAVLFEDKVVVRKLCKNTNVNLNTLNDHNQTPLQLAESCDNQDIIRIIQNLNSQRKNLEKASTNVTCKPYDNITPAHCFSSDPNKVQTAVPKTKNINERNNLGQTLLHGAVLRNDFKSAEQLLKQGADPNIQDNNGNTPLLIVTKNRSNIKLLKLLLEDERTDLNIKNNKGECFVNLVLDKFKKIDSKKNKPYLKLLAKYCDGLNDESKQIISSNRIFDLIFQTGYRNNPSAVLGVLIQPVVSAVDKSSKSLLKV